MANQTTQIYMPNIFKKQTETWATKYNISELKIPLRKEKKLQENFDGHNWDSKAFSENFQI